MIKLVKHYRREKMTEGAKEAHSRYIALLDRVKAYIAKNHQRHITTEELAGICYFSIEYFCRFFKQIICSIALSRYNNYNLIATIDKGF